MAGLAVSKLHLNGAAGTRSRVLSGVEDGLTGQVPPEMMRSKERASGMPWDMPLEPDLTDSWMDFCLSTPESEPCDELARDTCAGRR